jgi:hypothetical protein
MQEIYYFNSTNLQKDHLIEKSRSQFLQILKYATQINVSPKYI